MNKLSIIELKEKQIWVDWNGENNGKDGKTKIPFSAKGGATGTSENYRNTWSTYIEAKTIVNQGKADGVGFVLTKITDNLALAAIDIDHRGLNDDLTQDIINMFSSYTEYSPSGQGFHIYFLVDLTRLPDDIKEKYYMKNPYNQVECYIAEITNRYLTYTGNSIMNKDICERTEQLLQFLDTHMSRNIKGMEMSETTKSNDNYTIPTNVPENDEDIINTILHTKQKDKFTALYYNGDKSDYNDDDSSAEMALTTMLAFYVGADFERIDRMMRNSKLYRVKWERHDYKEMTIKKAIANCEGDFFNWDTNKIQETKKDKPKATIQSLTAKELLSLQLKPSVPIVENLLYPGFSILAGSPKVGKSWFCLDLGISTGNGEPFLTFNTNKVETLYLALEDSEYRLQSRISKILGQGKEAPEGFHLATDCHVLDEGLLEELQNKIEENPNIKLVIIDTLQKVRGAQVRGETWYASDYKEVAKLKKFADENDICILAIHHLRKQKDTDVFNQISGSTGITGVADTMIVLNKLGSSNEEVMMSITGRDVDFSELVVKFNKETCKWEVASQVSDYENYRKQLEYKNNPIVTTLKALIVEHPEGLRITATKLLDAIIAITGIRPRQKSPQALSREINENLQFQLWDFDRIYYEQGNSNGGKNGREMYFSQEEKRIEKEIMKQQESKQDETDKRMENTNN